MTLCLSAIYFKKCQEESAAQQWTYRAPLVSKNGQRIKKNHLQFGQKAISIPAPPWSPHLKIVKSQVDEMSYRRHTLPRANGPAFTAAVTKRRVAGWQYRDSERERRDRIWAITALWEDGPKWRWWRQQLLHQRTRQSSLNEFWGRSARPNDKTNERKGKYRYSHKCFPVPFSQFVRLVARLASWHLKVL